MTYAQIRDKLYKVIGYSGASELYNDNDMKDYINFGIAEIESRHEWSFQNKTIDWTIDDVGTTGTIFTLDREIYKVYSARAFEGTPPADGSGYTSLMEVNETVDKVESSTHSITNIFKCNVKTIETKDAYATLRVYANYGLVRIENTETDWNKTVDLPELLLPAVFNFAASYMYPFFIDTGFEQARYFRDLAVEQTNKAISKYSSHTGVKNATAKRGY